MSDDMDANALPLLEKRKSGLVIFFFVLSLFSPLSAGDKFYFMIRVDDIMSRNTTILPRSIIPFQDTVESRGAFVSWAVIPSRLIETTNSDGAITHELKRTVARGHEILIHGYVHICQRCGDSGHEMFCAKNNSAFSYAEQKKLLVDGQKILAD
ncbi:MAG: DUF2334 domain-containing protein, partial [Ignavibacteriales bacterium]|nr:DUF2334 domain-containing protein [Ignavibacteriales bacterium]